jgi:transposase
LLTRSTNEGEALEKHIKVALGLPGIAIIQQEEVGTGVIRLMVARRERSAVCPHCRRVTTKVHDTRARVKADQPLGDQSVSLVVLRRRFACSRCPGTFTEDDSTGGRRRRLTRRLRTRMGEESVSQSVQQVARTYEVSPATVRWAQAEYAEQQGETAPAPLTQLGIDEHSVRKGCRYVTGLHDLTRHRLFDVVEGRTSTVLQAALEKLPTPETIKVVSMDMSGTFRAAVQAVLPDVAIVADKYHVVARITKAVHDVWRRLLGGKGRADPLRRIGRWVLRGREQLSPEEEVTLRLVLRPYPALQRAWLLKEDFRRWYRTASATSARLELSAWRRMIGELPDLPEIRALEGMLHLWQEEILNYFTFRVTQGPVEGQNNRAKVIQRRAYGYRNFTNYRRRLLLAG